MLRENTSSQFLVCMLWSVWTCFLASYSQKFNIWMRRRGEKVSLVRDSIHIFNRSYRGTKTYSCADKKAFSGRSLSVKAKTGVSWYLFQARFDSAVKTIFWEYVLVHSHSRRPAALYLLLRRKYSTAVLIKRAKNPLFVSFSFTSTLLFYDILHFS